MGSGDDSDGASAQTIPDLGPVPERLEIDAETVRRLVVEQFGQWATLPVTPVREGGWDNHTFHLGDDLLVRMPSAAAYALAVEKEQHWLPRLAGQLPLPVPSPCGLGVPGEGYPFHWTVQRWLPGERASFAAVADQQMFADELAGFVLALRRVDPTGGPQPGIHNWFRGATLRTYDATARRALAALTGTVDVDRAAATWQAALDAPWDGEDTWFHGDLAEGNLLLVDGRLTAVIDFGTCGVGDPSCDLALAWTLLTSPARRTFRDRLGVDDASWARGRGWALWKTLSGLAGAVDDGDEAEAASLTRVLDELLRD